MNHCPHCGFELRDPIAEAITCVEGCIETAERTELTTLEGLRLARKVLTSLHAPCTRPQARPAMIDRPSPV